MIALAGGLSLALGVVGLALPVNALLSQADQIHPQPAGRHLQAAGAAVDRLRRRRQRAGGPPRHREPLAGQHRPGAADPDQRRAGHRGLPVLHPRRHRHQIDRAGPGLRRQERRRGPRGVDHHPAAGQDGSQHAREDPGPQDQRRRHLRPAGGPLLQAADPGGLPEHGVLRQRRLRGAGGVRDLLQRGRLRGHRPTSGAARGHHPRSPGLRPAAEPARLHRPAQLRAPAHGHPEPPERRPTRPVSARSRSRPS